MPDNTFDIVSKIEMPEVVNAVQQAHQRDPAALRSEGFASPTSNSTRRTIRSRWRAPTSSSSRRLSEVLQQKLVKRKVPLKGFTYGPIEPAAGFDRAAGDYAAAGHPDREGARDREGDQGQQEESAGLDQGDLVRVSGRGSRHAAGSDGAAARPGFRHRHAVHELSARTDGAADRIAVARRGRRENWKRCSRSRRIGDPREAALVCHPHPQHGGTMHNKVVYRIARGLRRAGAVVLRFNYRGVNKSEGVYDGGAGEKEDARAALEYSAVALSGAAVFAGGVFVRIADRSAAGVRDSGRRRGCWRWVSRRHQPETAGIGNCDIPRVLHPKHQRSIWSSGGNGGLFSAT